MAALDTPPARPLERIAPEFLDLLATGSDMRRIAALGCLIP